MQKLFDGIRIIDFTNNVAGPSCTALFADFGADVIKIEKPSGDDNRRFAPFIEGESISAMWLNRGKKSIILDMKKPEGVEIAKELVRPADIIVESFRPGMMKKWGLDYNSIVKINPNVIMCSLTGYGQTGPDSAKPGYDMIAQAISGYMYMSGSPHDAPTKIGPAIGDWVGGLNAFGYISAALYYRQKTGEGQYIDISLIEGLIGVNEYCEPAFNGIPPMRCGNHMVYIAPYGVFTGNDGEIVIAATSEKLWAQLCELMEQPDLLSDPRFVNAGERAKHKEILIPIIEDWLKSFPTVEEPFRLLEENGIACCKVNAMTDILANKQLQARGIFVDLKTKALSSGKIVARGIGPKLSKTPGEVITTPALGEHTKEILKEVLGCDDEQVNALKDAGAIDVYSKEETG
jgi:crotonobetainyl-CoA:carnitine CoA-transferase CaiB-like acyl-CoA transferase